nr:MAG TPA: minor tail protein [Caudoviricetes sp.]
MIRMQLAVENGIGSFDELIALGQPVGVTLKDISSAVQDGGKNLTNLSKKLGVSNKDLKAMYKEADTAAMSLIQFSDVAGMTNAEFAEMFKNDPSKAIMKFVEGLSHAEEKGKSAISVLDDMDITEVRLRDSLLRAANASGIFGEAIETGNSAFEENTALAEEAGKRYETVESQLGMLKNEVTDVAIEFGGPFLGALRDGVKVAKPFIKTLADMAKKFSEANPETQQTIMKYIGLAAAIGPASKVMGGFLKITGGGISTVGKLSQWLGKMSGTAKASKTALEIAGTGATTFGSAASAAAGSQGVGAMITALGSGGLAGALPLIVGAGGLLALGYGAWKTFGEEAWNSSQRVNRWGEDVGVATDKTLQTVQSKTQEASGQFGLMAQGFEGNTDSMISNFQKIGSVIENDLTSKLEAYKQAVDLLPSELQGKANEYIEQKEQEAQRTLEIVQKNNDEILKIKKEYVDKEGNVTAQGAKMIQDLMRESTEEYLNIAVTDADKRKEVMNALTGDLTTATEKQAEAWLQSLGKQRQATKASYTEDINDYRKKLEATGQLSEDEIDTMVGFYEKARDTSTDAFDAQMALIVQKYPELASKISLANGQLIDTAGEGTQAFIAENQKIIDNAANLADELAAKSRETAEQLAWTADQTTLAGKTWNDLKLIDKEGKIKTNAAEIVTEATKDSETWNNMRLVLHDANLDSNAKLVIGEAAIANGWWDGMAWEDKQAVLENGFQQTIFEALRANGDWAEMSFDEKKAILYSNTPEKMAETMANLGLWDEYQPEIKNLGADNTKLLEILLVSEDRMKNWNELPDDVKEIMADNYDLTEKIYQSERMFNAWKELPDSEKKMLGNNEDVLTKILNSENALKDWNSMPEIEKKILGNNSDLLSKVYRSEDSIMAWNKLPINVKAMLGDNVNILSKVRDGTISIETYNRNVHPNLKILYGDESSLQNALKGASSGISSYNNNAIPSTKKMVGVDAASGPASNAFSSVLNFKNNLPDVISKTVRADFIGPVIPGRATGDPYFQGGPVWLGDGGKQEPFLTPQGDFGVSPSKWTMFNLPKGTKIWSSVQKLMDSLPRYANGTKFDDTKLSRLSVASNNFANPPAPASTQNQVDLKEVIKLLRIIAQKNFIISKDAIGSIANEYAGESFFKLLYNGGGLN